MFGKSKKPAPAATSKTTTAPAPQKEVKKDDKAARLAAAQRAILGGASSDDRKLIGKFVIKKAKDGSYMFNLIAANSMIVATSQMYTTLDACKNGIASVSANAPTAKVEDQTLENYAKLPYPKFEMYVDKANEYRFRLLAKNGQNVLASQGYSMKENCINGINSVKHNSKTKETVIE
jgi:uncharacterized protein YegP (UPF0339 family)